MKKRSRILILLILSVLILVQSACGINKGSQRAETNTAVNDKGQWVGIGECYKAEPLNSPENIYMAIPFNGNMYYICPPQNGESAYSLYISDQKLCDLSGEIYGADSSDSGIWLLQEEKIERGIKRLFTCISSDGAIVSQFELGEEYYSASINEGIIYASGYLFVTRQDEPSIITFSESDGSVREYPLPNKNVQMIKAGDGQVYVSEKTEEGNALSLVNTATGTIMAKFTCSPGRLYTGDGESIMLLETDDGLYALNSYGVENPIVLWRECSINPGIVYEIFTWTEGSYICWSSNGVYKLSPTDYNSIKNKSELCIAAITPSEALYTSVTWYNRSNPNYYVRIVDYSYGGEYTPEQAITRLNTEILSGNAPDMICFDGLSPYPYIRKKLLANMLTFFEKDNEIDLEDIIISRALTNAGDGEIYYISRMFSVETMLAQKREFGNRYGWTLNEYAAIDNSLAEGEPLINNMTREVYVNYVLSRYIRTAVDWANCSCEFNSRDFISLLELGKNLRETPETPDNIVFGFGGELVGRGERRVAYSWINAVWTMAYEEKLAGGELSFIGYPTADGSCGSDVLLSCPVGIMSNGKEMDACWDFIKYMLMSEESNNNVPSMPVYKPLLDKAISEAKADKMLPVKMTDEDAEKFLAFIAAIENVALYDETILEIISDETQPLFYGDRSSVETAKIIQSKVSIYLSEQS